MHHIDMPNPAQPPTGIPSEVIIDEVSQAISLGLREREHEKAQSPWKWATLILGTLVVAGTIVSTFGRAFYVPRDEYTAEIKTNAVAHESIRVTLEQLNTTLRMQAEAFKATTEAVQTLRVDVATVKRP